MARSDLVKALLRNHQRGDDAGFQRAAKELIDDERRKRHDLVAERAIPAGERRPRSVFGGRDRRHDDLPGHGRRIRETIADITMRHQRRPQVLGVDPRLILVFELGASIDADEFRRAGLRVVDSSDGRLVVAFADDPELARFTQRLDAFAGGIPAGRQSEPYAQFFDTIEHVRPLAPQDRVTPELASAIRDSGHDTLRIDVECWHPGASDRAQEWLSETNDGIEAAEGRVVDTLINDSAGLVLLRAYVHTSRIMDVAELDAIARMDVLPQPALPMPRLYSLSAAELPECKRLTIVQP